MTLITPVLTFEMETVLFGAYYYCEVPPGYSYLIHETTAGSTLKLVVVTSGPIKEGLGLAASSPLASRPAMADPDPFAYRKQLEA